MKNIYNLACQQMDATEIENEKDSCNLYLKVTEVSKQLMENYDYKDLVITFIDHIDKELWYEIPLAYIAYLEKEERKRSK